MIKKEVMKDGMHWLGDRIDDGLNWVWDGITNVGQALSDFGEMINPFNWGY